MYLSRAPRLQALSGFVGSVEYVRDPPAHERERLIPTGEVSLVVTLVDDGFSFFDSGEHHAAGACLVGPRQRPQVLSTRAQHGMIAVNFRTGGASPFIPAPMSAAIDAYVPMQDCWGRAGAVLREQVMHAGHPDAMLDVVERVLLAQSVRGLERDAAVEQAVTALDRGDRVATVIERFGTTAKPFVRRFTQAVGASPKRYSRIRRIQRLLRMLPADGSVDWAAVAVSAGFYDQSHLIRDFTEMTGIRPSQYAPRSALEVNHVPC